MSETMHVYLVKLQKYNTNFYINILLTSIPRLQITTKEWHVCFHVTDKTNPHRNFPANPFFQARYNAADLLIVI